MPTSDSSVSVTRQCQLYSNLLDSSASPWLDTVGWEVSEYKIVFTLPEYNVLCMLFAFSYIIFKNLNFETGLLGNWAMYVQY